MGCDAYQAMRSRSHRAVAGRETIVHVNCLHESANSYHQHKQHGGPFKEPCAVELAFRFHTRMKNRVRI